MEQVIWNGQPVKKACNTCGSIDWFEIRSIVEGAEMLDWCSECKDPVQVSGTPDAYLPRMGMTFDNLCDKMGKPIPIMSKVHKVQVMKELGVIEAGDRHHGSTSLPSKSWIEGTREHRKREFDKKYRPLLKKAYKDWKEKRA